MTKKNIAKIQAREITYELYSLGWKSFQSLCNTVIAEIWGQTVQGFFDSHDGGRDGAFYGTWQQKDGELFEGSFTVQCKFTSAADKQIRPTDLTDELAKAKLLAARGLTDNYFLFTNFRLQGTTEEEISKMFEAVPGIKKCRVYGCERISQMIQESPRLRMLVPRIYGLGDLSQIFDERAYDQAREILSALGDDLRKFVITGAYQRSAKALADHGFVLLLGEPACGKSSIAAALAVGALDTWKCPTLKIRGADDFVRHSNPHEKQFFWVDDAFGATQLDMTLVSGWNNALPHVQAAIRRGSRIVFTSRSHIYQAARSFLKESSMPVIKESKVVIYVEDLTKDEKEQILYNHIRLGDQNKEFKAAVKEFLPAVALHSRFSPEIARRLGNPIFTKNLHISKYGLEDFVSRPVDLLREIITTLDCDSRSVLALIFMRAGVLPSPISMTDEEENAIKLLGGSSAGIRTAVNALDNSLLLYSIEEGGFTWRFKHPTIRDAFASLVAENREMMDIYIAGAPVERLFREVSCGNVDIEGVKVIVPRERYNIFMERIETFGDDPLNRNSLHWFLATRCNREFLEHYMKRYPNFIKSLQVGSYLNVVSDVAVIVRLHELKILPEDKRKAVVSRIRDLAVDTPDSGFLRDDIRTLFTSEEFQDILDHVKKELLPNLPGIVSAWHSDFDRDYGDPEEYFDNLKTALQDFQIECMDDSELSEYLHNALVDIKEAVSALRDRHYSRDEEDYDGGSSSSSPAIETRSIFEDVDH